MQDLIFQAGSVKRFSDFISRLGKEKTAILSHNADLDGIASAKIINEVIEADFIKFVSYTDLNLGLAEELSKLKVKKIIISDLYVKSGEFINTLEKFSEILIIDHHLFEKDWNSDKTVFINAKGYCAAYLCYHLFSMIKDISYYDWLAVCASITDMQWKNNIEWIKKVFIKHNEELNSENLKECLRISLRY
jgi:single-stranded DNA-specific DHH superfamily exonuclease